MTETVNGLFQKEQDYYRELLAIVKKRLELYSKTTVFLKEDGGLERMRGKLIFQQELDRLSSAPFTKEEIASYQRQMQLIEIEEAALRKRGIASMEHGCMIALEYLCRIFGLGELEYYLISMSLAAELDGQFERIFCLLQDDYGLKLPTLDLCLRILTLDEELRLSLLQQVMERISKLAFFFEDIEKMDEGASERRSFLTTPLKLDRRMLLFLQDITSVDEVLKNVTKVVLPGDAKEPLVIRENYVDHLWQMSKKTTGKNFLLLSGSKGIGKRTLVERFAKKSGRNLLVVQTDRLMSMEEPQKILKRLVRESYIRGHAWICFLDTILPEEPDEPNLLMNRILWGLKDYVGLPIFTSQTPWNSAWDSFDRNCLEFRVPEISVEEREILWETCLEKELWPENVTPERIANKYMLTPGGIKKAVIDAKRQCLLKNGNKLTDKMLFSACQQQLIHKLGKDALRVKSPYSWDDLILPDHQKELLRDACNQVEFQGKVYRDWGFSEKVAYGRGVSMIFYGPPGTGKTMGAQVIANELGLELYKINMASIMSRYVGESEKKLDVVFEQGRKSQSILFFDEADVLFGKRSETKDAQDRYANASTAYLLQKLEEYEGIIILATNFLQNFDNAFCRRFKFIIEFPFPDEQRRLEIWNHVFPDRMEMAEEIDTQWLAEEFKFSGSHIKNIALAASFLAAGENTGLTMKHVLTALKREQQKVGKQMIASDFGRYYYLME